ncbi:MAG: DUF4037 domain-containing protein [Cellulomonas sp.]|nr:DUF4037 domain-containing protein [Cellulomonas sp.]
MSAPSADPIDVPQMLRGLDAIFAAHQGPTHAEPYLLDHLVRARAAADAGAELTVLNELMGFYRSQSRHEDTVRVGREALALAERMDIVGSDAYATTLINTATGLRAAGRHDEALDLYRQALAASEAAMAADDRRLAALHNNLSVLLSDREDAAGAERELRAALAILEASSVDPGGDLDLASTHTNLALVCLALGRDDEAAEHAQRSLDIFAAGAHENDAHYASALAGHAQVCFRLGRFADAAGLYRQALAIIAECYGVDTDQYAVTAANLAEAETAVSDRTTRVGGREQVTAPSGRAVPSGTAEPAPSSASTAPADVSGLDLARAYWETYGRPLLESKYPTYRPRIAAGLVGHGSECYGFDDETSRDHDFGPGFCLWLTAADHAAIGEQLQADYEALPASFRGFGPRVATPRARADRRRVGVFEIGDFYEQVTGYRQAPAADHPHEWLLLDEATLAAATNGEVFVDGYGEFSAVRDGFRRMPAEVRWALISRRLGMAAQAGQYNVPRMLDRGDGAAAWLSVAQFTQAVASMVFLLNGPGSAGYLPYYKWQFAALRRLSARRASRLPQVAGELEQVLRLASAACFGGAGFGEGGTGAAPARERVVETIELVCAQVVDELRARGLSSSDDTFLEHQRLHVEQRITDPWLRSL